VLYNSIFPISILNSVPRYTRSDGNGRSGWKKLIGSHNHRPITEFPWEAPIWKGRFRHIQINMSCDKDLLIIHNKYTTEWGKPPINFISLDVMKELHEMLSEFYTVVIIHPEANAKNYSCDHQKMEEMFDYSGMYTIQDIMNANPSLDYNTVQFALHDMCTKYISVQGGSSRIASLFGGTNVILHVQGSEHEHDEYNRVLSRLSDVKIHVVSNGNELLSKVNELYILSQSPISYPDFVGGHDRLAFLTSF